jgi:hypothetical protein
MVPVRFMALVKVSKPPVKNSPITIATINSTNVKPRCAGRGATQSRRDEEFRFMALR